MDNSFASFGLMRLLIAQTVWTCLDHLLVRLSDLFFERVIVSVRPAVRYLFVSLSRTFFQIR